METARMKLGRIGEELACQHLIARGHTIVARNWRSGHLEIDIVSIDGDGMHFVEVKSRVAPVSAAPEDNVGYAKRKKLIAAARAFLKKERQTLSSFADLDVMFDIVSIIFEGEKTDIVYYPQAFIPMF